MATGFRSARLLGVSLTTLSLIIILLAMKSGYLESLELGIYDRLIRWRSQAGQSVDAITLIEITEADIQQLGHYPVTDQTLAKAIQMLEQYKPRVIGLDIYRDQPVPPGHDALNRVLTQYDNLIALMKIPEAQRAGISGPASLQLTDRVGFSDMPADLDCTVRRGLLFMEMNGQTEYSLAWQLTVRYLQTEGIMPQADPTHPDQVRLGSVTIPFFEANDGGYSGADAGGYQFLMDFRTRTDQLNRYTLSELLSGQILPAHIQGKIVLLGVTAVSVKDNFYTPLDYHPNMRGITRGLELQALAVDQLLRHALNKQGSTKTLTDSQEIMWVVVWYGLGLMIGLHAYWFLSFVAAFALGLSLLMASVCLAFFHDWWLLSVAPGVSWVLSMTLSAAYAASKEKRQRLQLMNLFSRHVSPEIADNIWQHRKQFVASGWPRPQRLTATVMFTDICAFTAISEQLTPARLVDWLNEYMEALTPLTASHGGVINRFIGDAMMVVFGIPVARLTQCEIQADARNAVHCAVIMQTVLKRQNADWQQRGLPTVGTRIGIYTGEMVAGSVGASQRMEYTLHGDTVNIAARLESFNKEQFTLDPLNNPCRILIGEATFQYLDQSFEVGEKQRIALRGKTHAINIYHVLGLKHEPKTDT